MSEHRTEYNPSDHFIPMKGGKEYLPVAQRIVWFRRDYPEGTIETTIVELREQRAVFRARVTTGMGGSAEATGTETPQDFGDYVEKAETKAVGRALGYLGYGTAAAGFEEGARIVDTPQPARRKDAAKERPATADATPPTGAGASDGGAPARPIGWTEVWSEARKRGITDRDQLAKYLGANPGGMDPASIYQLLVAESAKELAGVPAGVAS